MQPALSRRHGEEGIEMSFPLLLLESKRGEGGYLHLVAANDEINDCAIKPLNR
jgi:hypothetical protein